MSVRSNQDWWFIELPAVKCPKCGENLSKAHTLAQLLADVKAHRKMHLDRGF